MALMICRPLLGFVALGLALAVPVSAFEVPYLSGRVVDTAGALSPAVREQLEDQLAALERETGAQVVVLTVATIEGATIEGASMKVVETWKLGRADADDGVLLMVARDDRTLRIEVGYGLEGALPDARTRRIIDAAIVPRFKGGDFDGGITQGVAEIEKAIRGEADTLPQTTDSDPGRSMPRVFGLGLFLLFMLPFVWPAIAIRGATGWFLVLFLSPFMLVFGALFLGAKAASLAAGWLVIGTIARLLLPKRLRMSEGSWSSGSGGGGGWSSGSGGGGFSGGGGSFGGGGSSGRW